MKTAILVALAAVMLVGCGALDRKMSELTGDPSKVCIDGVLYLQFTSGASVAYTPEGKVKLCGK